MAKKKVNSVDTQSGDIAVQASSGVTSEGSSSTEGQTLSSEIARLTQAKADIKAAIEAKGVTVGNGTIDTYASKIGEISSGGSSSEGKCRIDLSKGYKFGHSSFSVIDAELYIGGSPLTSTENMFYYCSRLTSVLLFDTSKVTNMKNMFNYCSNLTSVPLFDTSNVTNMSYMFYECLMLTSVPQFNTSKVTDMSYMFYDCSTLRAFPQFDTSEVKNMSNMCRNCLKLTSVPLLNTSKVTSMTNAFSIINSALTTLGGFTGLNVALDLSRLTALTHDSIMNVINEAADVTASPKTLTLGSTNLAKLTAAEKAVATNKGWTLK